MFELNAERYAQEAELRFALVRLNEHIDSVALYAGEGEEKQRLRAKLEDVLRVMRRIISASTSLTWITTGYGWLTLIAPILVAAPGYFGGKLSFGALMMAVGAFMQVQQALRWFIDNFGTIADWRATLLRIASFREAAAITDRLGVNESRIEFVEAPSGEFAIEDLQIAMPTGCAMLSERHVKISPGERVLIIGEPGSGKTILFRAIAGLWPWGTGRVMLPPLRGVMFIPHQPYVPLGTLRAALAYPSPETNYTDEQLVGALQRAGLIRLSSWLDRIARWDRELMEDEQQCLVFTRLLLHKPRWLVMDEGLDALDRDTRERVISLFKESLEDTAIVNIGRPEAKDPFFTRVLHLIKDPHGRYFFPGISVALVSEAKAATEGLPCFSET